MRGSELASGFVGEKRSGLRALDIQLCDVRIRVHFDSEERFQTAQAYFRPSILPFEKSALLLGEVQIIGANVSVLRGPPVSLAEESVLFQLEALLIQWCSALYPQGRLLHSGCVVYRGTPILFLAHSGSGKSTLTLAGVRAGAQYITDDLLLVERSSLSGLARAIRFKAASEGPELESDYLGEMDLQSYRYLDNHQLQIVPIWSGKTDVVSSISLENRECVVVRVSQGPDRVERMSELDRVVLLHESVIAHTNEYDGSLGSGPSFDLSWQDPAAAFQLLLRRLEESL